MSNDQEEKSKEMTMHEHSVFGKVVSAIALELATLSPCSQKRVLSRIMEHFKILKSESSDTQAGAPKGLSGLLPPGPVVRK